MVCLNAPPSAPTRLVAGTRTSVRKISQKCELPTMSRTGRTSMPSRSMGTISSLRPLCGGPSLLVRQIT